MTSKISFGFVCGLLILGMFCGCGGERRPKDMPVLRPVTLTITQEGRPLEMAVVILVSKNPDHKLAASGITDDHGEALMRTSGKYVGVPEGKYKVMISKKSVEVSQYPGPKPKDERKRADYFERRSQQGFDIFLLVSSQYCDPMTTPLSLEVTRHGANEIFDVGKAVRETVPPKEKVDLQTEITSVSKKGSVDGEDALSGISLFERCLKVV